MWTSFGWFCWDLCASCNWVVFSIFFFFSNFLPPFLAFLLLGSLHAIVIQWMLLHLMKSQSPVTIFPHSVLWLLIRSSASSSLLFFLPSVFLISFYYVICDKFFFISLLRSHWCPPLFFASLVSTFMIVKFSTDILLVSTLPRSLAVILSCAFI